MARQDSKQVRLFLADGSVGGLMTAEIMNWTGHILKGKRIELAEILRRPEAERTGVYILFGTDEDDVRVAYIGETDKISKRLPHHVKAKDYWDEVVIITSKDANLTSAHVRYLEAKLVVLAKGIGRYDVKNVQLPSGGAELPEADASDMDYFIQQLRILLPVLGHDIFRGRGAAATVAQASDGMFGGQTASMGEEAANSPDFALRTGRGVHATAQLIDSEFTVLRGSVVRAAMREAHTGLSAATVTKHKGRSRVHAEMLRDAEPNSDGETATLIRDHIFSSPSAAAAVVQGMAASNGRTLWKCADGTTYGEWEDAMTETAG